LPTGNNGDIASGNASSAILNASARTGKLRCGVSNNIADFTLMLLVDHKGFTLK